MNKLIYITFLSFVLISCKSDLNQDIDSAQMDENDSLHKKSFITDSIDSERTNLPIHGEINRVNLTKYYPHLTDTIKNLKIMGSEKIDINPGNGVIVSLLHNSGTFDQMILCTHDKNLSLIDKLYIGKATDFDNGKSHTIDFSIVNNNEITFHQVDWGYVKNENIVEIDTVKYVEWNIHINENGQIKNTKTVPKGLSNY